MRLPLLLVIPLSLVAAGAGPSEFGEPAPPSFGRPAATGIKLAALGDSLPGLLVDLVNKSIKGTIKPRKVAYKAPATAILDDIVVLDPRGNPVAQVDHLEATASLTAILAGRIEIDSLTVRAPKLLLELKDGTLNLAEAFEPKTPSTGDAPDLTVVIQSFEFKGGGLRFRDGENVTIVADNAKATGKVRIKLAESRIRVDVDNLRIASGAVKLKELDVPFRDGRVAKVVYKDNRINLEGVSGTVLDNATASVAGAINLSTSAGDLVLDGQINAKPGVWPARLSAPPFPLPAFSTAFSVRGPFANPVITVDGATQKFRAYDYGIRKVDFRARVTKDAVTLRKTAVALEGGGDVNATGGIILDTLALDLKLDIDGVPLSVAAGPAKLEPPPRGSIDGTAFIKGRGDGKSPIDVTANLAIANAKAFDLNLPAALEATATLSVLPERIEFKRSEVRTRSKSLVASATGTIDLKREQLGLKIQATAARPLGLVKNIPSEIAVGTGGFVGRVEGPFKNPKVIGTATAETINAYDVTSPKITAQLLADKHHVVVGDIAGRVLRGTLKGDVRVNLDRKALPLAVHIELDDADLSAYTLESVKSLGLKGKANVVANVSGPASSPTVIATVDAHDVVVQEETLGEVSTALTVTPDRIVARELTVSGPLLNARSAAVQFQIESQALAGRVSIVSLALDQVVAAKDAKLNGAISGIVDLAGTANAPRAFARLNVKDLAVDTNAFGEGPIDVCLKPSNVDDPAGATTARARCLHILAASQAPSDGASQAGKPLRTAKASTTTAPLLVQASGSLDGPQGEAFFRGAYDLEQKEVHARVRVTGVDLGPLVEQFAPDIGPLEGVADARATIFGPIDAIDADVDLTVPNLVMKAKLSNANNQKETLVDDLRAYESRGKVWAHATMRRGMLDAKVCGFPGGNKPDSQRLCPDGARIEAVVHGPLRQSDGAFDLQLKYDVAEDEIERFVSALRENDLAASVHVDGTARLWRVGAKGAPPFPLADLPPSAAKQSPSAEDRPVQYDVNARLLQQSILAPGAPRATLARRAKIHVSGAGDIELVTPLRYEIGESEVVIKGSLNSERIDATIDGTLALALLKLFPDAVSNASGTAVANLTLEGPYRPLPRIRGQIVPTPGAIISPRGLGQRVQFASGRLIFSGLENSPLEQRVEAEELAVSIDDGIASLDGDVVVQLPANATDHVVVSKWNLRASGVGIRVKASTTFVETAFDLSLQGNQARPLLAGNVEVTDGYIREQFELKNFVLTSSPGSPPTPLVEVLRPASLENLAFDVNIGVRNFRAQADIATFGLDAILVGDLRLTQSARLYAISGAVEVSQGDIRFPYATFDIEQTRIEFPPASAGLEPKIYLDARADLPTPKNGLESDLPCELQLDGDVDRLKLSLRAPDAPRSVSETDLLKFVLFGVPLTAGDLSADPDAALRAVSSELSSDVSRQVEQAIQDNFGTALQLNIFAGSTQAGAGLRYEVGSRLDVEGETGVAYGNTNGGIGGLAGQVRVRLLLFDHLPGLLGEEAAVEGQIKTSGAVAADATRGELRLTWRVFEQ